MGLSDRHQLGKRSPQHLQREEARSGVRSNPHTLDELITKLTTWAAKQEAANPHRGSAWQGGAAKTSVLKTPPGSPSSRSTVSGIYVYDGAVSPAASHVSQASSALERALNRSLAADSSDNTYESGSEATSSLPNSASETALLQQQLAEQQAVSDAQQSVLDTLVARLELEGEVNTRTRSQARADQKCESPEKAEKKVAKLRKQVDRLSGVKPTLGSLHNTLHRGFKDIQASFPDLVVMHPDLKDGKPTRVADLTEADTRIWEDCDVCKQVRSCAPRRRQKGQPFICATCAIENAGQVQPALLDGRARE